MKSLRPFLASPLIFGSCIRFFFFFMKKQPPLLLLRPGCGGIRLSRRVIGVRVFSLPVVLSKPPSFLLFFMRRVFRSFLFSGGKFLFFHPFDYEESVLFAPRAFLTGAVFPPTPARLLFFFGLWSGDGLFFSAGARKFRPLSMFHKLFARFLFLFS